MENKNLPNSKSLFPYYGCETDGSPIDDGGDYESSPRLSMAELWNKLHAGRPINEGK